MATIGNYKEEYLKYNSSVEEKPTVMPVTGDGIPEGMFLYDTSGSSKLYCFTNGAWVEQ